MEVKEYAPGTFSWAELATSNSEAAKKFYTDLFRWTPKDIPVSPDMIYTILQRDGKDVAALYQQTQATPPNWLSYVSVQNVADTTEKARSLGATIFLQPMDVMDIGRMAVLQDPAGAVFALWEPKKNIGATLVNEPGAVTWNELYTNDEKKAADFYTSLFGWGKETMDMGNMKYTLFKYSDGNRSAGGMLKIQPEWGEMPPHWLVYFAVEDCDRIAKKAKDQGGTIMRPPSDIPNIGRFSILRDPQGAAFAIIKLAPSQA